MWLSAWWIPTLLWQPRSRRMVNWRRYAQWWELQALQGHAGFLLIPQRRELNLVAQLTVREVRKCSPALCPKWLVYITGNPTFHSFLPLGLGKVGVGGRWERGSRRENWAVPPTPSAFTVFLHHYTSCQTMPPSKVLAFPRRGRHVSGFCLLSLSLQPQR